MPSRVVGCKGLAVHYRDLLNLVIALRCHSRTLAGWLAAPLAARMSPTVAALNLHMTSPLVVETHHSSILICV